MILSIDEARAYLSTSLTDEALLELLVATERDIAEVAPPSVTEYAAGGHASLVLAHPAGAIASVTEDVDGAAVALDATDYRVEGRLLRRLATGAHPASRWRGLVRVGHGPASDDVDRALRVRAQVALLQIELSVASGVAAERIGDYSVSYGMAKGPTYSEQRAAALAPLAPMMAA